MIKRKINREFLDDSDLSSILERGDKNISRKNLENIYETMMKNLQEVSKKQTELEKRIDILNKNNEEFSIQNKNLSEEYEERKKYTGNLENIIYFIINNAQNGVKIQTDALSSSNNMSENQDDVIFHEPKSSENDLNMENSDNESMDMFHEVNVLSPCLISSPNIKPRKINNNLSSNINEMLISLSTNRNSNEDYSIEEDYSPSHKNMSYVSFPMSEENKININEFNFNSQQSM